jgi:hypothetical protein
MRRPPGSASRLSALSVSVRASSNQIGVIAGTRMETSGVDPVCLHREGQPILDGMAAVRTPFAATRFGAG